MAVWKRDFASGLVVLVPIVVTLFLLNWLYSALADLPVVESLPQPYGVLVVLAVFALLVLSVGYMMRTAFGHVVEEVIDDAMNRVPVLRVVYNASKLAVETALTGTEDLQRPVKVEPWEGMRMTAFKTGKRTGDGREVLFIPTAPNITTGFVVEVDTDEVEPIDESVETALTRVLSAGFAEQEPTTGGVQVDEGDGQT
jgi:uncharacterized membrane protein